MPREVRTTSVSDLVSHFHDIVEILDLADLDGRLTLGVHGVQPGQIGTTFVDSYGVGCAILIDGLLEVPLGRFLVPPGSQQEVNRVAGLVDGAVQIFPLPLDFDVGLIDTPALADRALAAAERLFKHRHKLNGHRCTVE